MKNRLGVALLSILLSVPISRTDSITHSGTTINMDFVNIGYAGNAADTTGNGAVNYSYRIGKFEVTANQWASVIAADANVGAASATSGFKPADLSAQIEAAKFCNWLTSGNYNQGAYQFSDPNTYVGTDRASAISTYGTVYVLPTTDEWYKAAYLKSDGSGYSLYSTGDSVPVAGLGGVNFTNAVGGLWDVGSGTPSSIENNGTYDMSGNIWEWTDQNIGQPKVVKKSPSGRVGGAHDVDGEFLSSAFYNLSVGQTPATTQFGFRVAVIPEPSSVALMGFAAGIGYFMRRRLRR